MSAPFFANVRCGRRTAREEEKPHLALILGYCKHKVSRGEAKADDPGATIVALHLTMPYSLLPWPLCAEAMAHGLLREEHPLLWWMVPSVRRRLETLMSPVRKAEEEQREVEVYSRQNKGMVDFFTKTIEEGMAEKDKQEHS